MAARNARNAVRAVQPEHRNSSQGVARTLDAYVSETAYDMISATLINQSRRFLQLVQAVLVQCGDDATAEMFYGNVY